MTRCRKAFSCVGWSSDGGDSFIVRSTISLGQNLGLQAVAEGVEDDETLAQLAEPPCSAQAPAQRKEAGFKPRSAGKRSLPDLPVGSGGNV